MIKPCPLPCPFCGGEASFTTWTDFYGRSYHMVMCKSCDAKSGVKEAEEEAVEVWNKRVDGVLEAIDNLRRELSGYHGQLTAYNDLKTHSDRQRDRITELEGLHKRDKKRIVELERELANVTERIAEAERDRERLIDKAVDNGA